MRGPDITITGNVIKKAPLPSITDTTALISEQFEHRCVIAELSNLVVYGRTKKEAENKKSQALKAAKKNGSYGFRRDFDKARNNANKKHRQRRYFLQDRPRQIVKIGTKYGAWETISLPYYKSKLEKGERRKALIDCRCECGTERALQMSQVTRGHSKRCTGCSSKRSWEKKRQKKTA